MRLVVRALAFSGAAVISLALADPPTTPQQDVAAPPAASATAPSKPATPAKPAVDPVEKRLIAMGYKPEMHNGEKVFCKVEPELGSRLGGIKHCGTIAQLKTAEERTRDDVEMERQRALAINPQGR
jgi:hypothetical protein